jgi:putative cell wall-binding protein
MLVSFQKLGFLLSYKTHESAALGWPGSRRLLMAWLIVASFLAAFLVVGGPGSSARADGAPVDGTASIAGIVQGEGTPNVALGSVTVSLYRTDGVYSNSQLTGADGAYSFGDLEPGTYALEFDTLHSQGTTVNYISENWKDVDASTTGTPIVLVAGQNFEADAVLSLGGSISGTITADPATTSSYTYVTVYSESSGSWLPVANGYGNLYGSYTIPGLPAGTYRIGFALFAQNAYYEPEYFDDKADIADAKDVIVTAKTDTPKIDAQLKGTTEKVVTSRLAGNDRFETSAKVSAEYAPFAPGNGVVYVANGLDYPDALSAAPAAAVKGGPLLLTWPTSLPAVVKNEIVRLSPAKIVVVGGTGVVSDAVFGELKKLAPAIERQAGNDRYETSRIVAQKAFGTDGSISAFLATGQNYPDALSASAAAAAQAAPVILVNGATAKADTATLNLLKGLHTSYVSIAGGTATVSAGIESSVRSQSWMHTVTRLGGEDRYETSVVINRSAYFGSRSVYLAVGTGFADALAGAALAGKNYSPMYVVPGTCVPAAVLADIAETGTTNVVLLGGTGVLSKDVADLKKC